jgi:hypothetical protein
MLPRRLETIFAKLLLVYMLASLITSHLPAENKVYHCNDIFWNNYQQKRLKLRSIQTLYRSAKVKEQRQWFRGDAQIAAGLYIAGQRAPAGTYHELGSMRSITLDREDILPASLNGRVAEYVRQPLTFAEIQRQYYPQVKAG